MNVNSLYEFKMTLTDVPALDPITVFLENFDKGRGQITITCYGKAWTAYWGAMGDRTLSEFFCDCNTDYLANKLSTVDSTITDYHKISMDIDGDVNEQRLLMYQNEISEFYGEDWYYTGLPEITNPDYTYLCRIIEAVQVGFNEQFGDRNAD